MRCVVGTTSASLLLSTVAMIDRCHARVAVGRQPNAVRDLREGPGVCHKDKSVRGRSRARHRARGTVSCKVQGAKLDSLAPSHDIAQRQRPQEAEWFGRIRTHALATGSVG